jgi:uncharacterized protein
MNPARPKVVFDCNVLLQAAARQRGPAAECLRLVERDIVTLYLSRPILGEIRTVLTDAIVQAENLALTIDVVDLFLRKVAYRAELIRDVPAVFDYPRDPKDEKYIDLVAAINADYLVTWDKDLLQLQSGHDLPAKQLRQRFPALSVLNPVDFIGIIRPPAP